MMKLLQLADVKLWTGRESLQQLYFHEKIICDSLENVLKKEASTILLGYAVDEGVRRNKGRMGAVTGPDTIRKMMASISNHLPETSSVYDIGNVICHDTDLESSHDEVSEIVAQLVQQNHFPILIGGGHDLAYAHFRGLRSALKGTIGIINLDAHFDLREKVDQANSGTPFYQIAQENDNFNYLCLGIQKAANNRALFKTAKALGVQYVEAKDYTIDNFDVVRHLLDSFITEVDHLYLSIDLDGFSSAVAPGVSAPSPMGFSVDVVLKTLDMIIASKKLRSMDVVELNPLYDIDNSTARLAARLGYYVMSLKMTRTC